MVASSPCHAAFKKTFGETCSTGATRQAEVDEDEDEEEEAASAASPFRRFDGEEERTSMGREGGGLAWIKNPSRWDSFFAFFEKVWFVSSRARL
jgi:hypothetical protein